MSVNSDEFWLNEKELNIECHAKVHYSKGLGASCKLQEVSQ